MRWWFLIWCGCISVIATATAAPLPFSVQASAYLVEVDHQIRWEHQINQRLAPASLTKLMTVLLLSEHYEAQQTVTISAAAARETGSRLGLRAGEVMRVRDLLAASLINSANDACHALADHIAGNHSRFVHLMNQRAQEWGLKNTHFTNACGHDDVQHYSSVQDMATLAHKVMAQPALLQLMARRTMQISDVGGVRHYDLTNKNALIGRHEGAVGMKSGYTPKAGKCLVALVQREGVTILLVMLHDTNRWWDASDILDFAYAQSHHD